MKTETSKQAGRQVGRQAGRQAGRWTGRVGGRETGGDRKYVTSLFFTVEASICEGTEPDHASLLIKWKGSGGKFFTAPAWL